MKRLKSRNYQHLAEGVGIGTRDLKRTEVIGTPIKDALFDFAAIRRLRSLSSA